MLNLSSKFSKKTFRVGTRNSPLALEQTNRIIELLKSKDLDLEYEILTPEKITQQLLINEVVNVDELSYKKLSHIALNLMELDIIVHSMKDVSKKLSPEFVIGCVCLRDSCEDVVVMRGDLHVKTLDELPPGSVIGTGSLRRISKLKKKYPQHEIIPIKGDLDKRIQKLDFPHPDNVVSNKPYSALILAKAGIIRLNLQHRISQELLFTDTFYAVGQGALACECRTTDLETRELLSIINDEKSTLSCIAERCFLSALDCRASEAVAVQTIFNESELTLKVCVSSNDGSKSVEKEEKIQLNHLPSDRELNELTNKERFTGITIWGIDKLFLSKMIHCKNLGENLGKSLMLSEANVILKENRKKRKEKKRIIRNNFD